MYPSASPVGVKRDERCETARSASGMNREAIVGDSEEWATNVDGDLGTCNSTVYTEEIL